MDPLLDWYSPDEDSFTLIDCIKEENIRNSLILDLGTSTGCISESLHASNIILSSDLNKTALLNNKASNLLCMDLLSSVRQDLLDCIIFNPPYVPNSECPILGGGPLGRRVIDRFIREIECRKFYLLVIEANRPLEVVEEIENKGYKVTLKKIRKILGETIIILKCTL